jgi:oligosaccharide repeat unit polymerase
MKYHPAILMLMVWAGCIAVFFILPFQLQGRVMTLYGFLVLLLFIASFCVGSLAAARPQPQKPRALNVEIDFRLTDRALMIAAIIAIFTGLMDIQGRNVFDLADAYQLRSDRAGALIQGGASDSSLWFQIGFLTYPAGYVYLVREIAFKRRPALWRIGAFGLLPVLLASLAMGGRAPLFYAILMLLFGFALRRHVLKTEAKAGAQPRPVLGQPIRKPFKLGGPAKGPLVIFGLLGFIYFVQVFFARADMVGGVEAMFGVAQTSWGVNFNGPLSGVLFALFGTEGTYLIFVFAWYLVQGFVMSNTLFSDYQGSMLLGAYGIDLGSALARRLNGEFIATAYVELLNLNVAGFLPSAFGSLYVDLKFLGLLPCLLWGWLTGKVYRQVREGRDPRWLLVVPFITVGIIFSLVNTPIGFSNGLITHLWMIGAALAARVRTRQATRAPEAALASK